MEEGGGCVNCALVVAGREEAPGHLATFLLPGLFFLGLGLRWWVVLVTKWGREARTAALQHAGLPALPGPAGRPLPWEGGVKILLALLAAALTLGLPLQGPAPLLLSLYLFFLLSGLIDVLVFYCGYSILPEGIQSFILTIAFTMEAVIFQSLAPASAPHTLLLALVILSCALASILEVVFDNKLIKFCRTFFTTLQSSWLLHLGLLPAGPLPPARAALLFSWHIAGLFTLHLLILLLYSHCSRGSPAPMPALPSPSPSGSASHLVPCKFLALPASTLPSGRLPAGPGRSLEPSVVDMEPWDRLHYSTFGKPV